MLEFLKKIFQNGKQEEKKKATIRMHEMKEWLKERSKPVMEGMQHKVEDILMRVNEETQRTKMNLELLEFAKLQNDNIPYKAKQYMEGNRKTYIKAISSFLGHLEINNRDYFYLMDFCKFFDDLILKLNTGTLRSYTILQEFFGNETNKLAQNLRALDSLFAELKSTLNESGIVEVNKLKEKVESLNSRLKQKINVNVELRSLEAGLRLSMDEKNSLIVEIEKLKSSEEYRSFMNAVDEKSAITTAFYAQENAILQSFSVLERPLRKYSHTAFEHEEMVLKYMKDPIETLANDKKIVILDILRNLEKMLKEDSLQVDSRKKEKSIEELGKLDKESIDDFKKRYLSYRTKEKDLEEKIKRNGIQDKLNAINKLLEESVRAIELQSKEMEKLKGEADKADSLMSSSKSEIESSVRELFGNEITVEI